MNKHTKRNTALALVGLLALSIYILACTSFSPDDSKVLYPAFDASSGAIGMAVYDREARGSEMLFLPVSYLGSETNAVPAAALLRAEWLANGREIVVGYFSDKNGSDGGGLSVALIPWMSRKPFKLFHMPETKDAAGSFVTPLCVAGERLFLRTSDKSVARLDLRTGVLKGFDFKDVSREISLYPSPDGAGIFYFEPASGSDEKTVFGRLNPKDFSRKPLITFTNSIGEQSVVAYGRTGRVLAFLGSGNEKNELLVLREGRPFFTRSLDTRGEKRFFGNAILAPNGKSLWATFQQAKGTNAMSYGLMEIPFSDATPRELTLISDAPVEEDLFALYFQVAISHDAKTAAIASTYLACTEKPFKPSDCALFLVDLSDPKWKVTKIPIPMPAKRSNLMK